MIYLGLSDSEKEGIVNRYVSKHAVKKIVLIHSQSAPYLLEADRVTYKQAILYVYFYRLLQEIDQHTLIIVDECLRAQNRYDLTYNCIRHYINRTPHVIVFQLLPQIDERDDFMILFDFVTQSQWKRRKFDAGLIADYAKIERVDFNFSFVPVYVTTPDSTRQKYEHKKKQLFDNLGVRDPHTIPRNLYLIGGGDKRTYIDALSLPLFDNGKLYVARNRRLNRDNIATYGDALPNRDYTIVEFPHRFIDFGDFVRVTRQTNYDVLLVDLKIDRWYWQRYDDWKDRLNATYASL